MSDNQNEKLRAQILALLKATPNLTSAAVAIGLGKPAKQLRPRFTEMKNKGLIVKGPTTKVEGAKRGSCVWNVATGVDNG